MSRDSAALRLYIVTGGYPSDEYPVRGAFVRTFVHALVREGAEVCVVHPISVWERRNGRLPRSAAERVDERTVRVLRPLFPSLSVRKLGPVSTAPVTQWAFGWAVRRALVSVPFRPSAVYGHFLYQAGAAAVECGRLLSAPTFVAVGEGAFWTAEAMGDARVRRDFAEACGLIAVSTPVREALVGRFGLPSDRVGLFPNGVDRVLFQPRDRQEARRKFGIPETLFVAAFVGTFDGQKGGGRLVEAARGLPGTGLLMAGEGPVPLESPEVLFRGRVQHEAVPELLAAADVFVLPTLVEGSCNAVLEAMACGLPVVTAAAPYMDDLVNDTVAVRVDPMDIRALRAAVDGLRVDPIRRAAMGAAAQSHSAAFDIRARARRVLDWMSDRMASQGHERR